MRQNDLPLFGQRMTGFPGEVCNGVFMLARFCITGSSVTHAPWLGFSVPTSFQIPLGFASRLF